MVDSLERAICLFPQQEIRERIENKSGEELYLTKSFIMKTKRNTFIKQLLRNCLSTMSSDFHNDTGNFEG